MDSGPLGFGANLNITFLSSPISKSGRPILFFCFSRFNASGLVISRISLTCSKPNLLANIFDSSTCFDIRGINCFALALNSGNSESSLPRTLPDLPDPLYSTAFCSAYLRIAETISGPHSSSSDTYLRR